MLKPNPSPPIYPGPYNKPKPAGIGSTGIEKPSFTKPKPAGVVGGNSFSKPTFSSGGIESGPTKPPIPVPKTGIEKPSFAAGGGTPAPPFYIPPSMNPSMWQMYQHRLGGGAIPPWMVNDPRWDIIRQRYMGNPGQTDPYTPGPSRAQVPFGPPPPMEGEMWPNLSAGRSMTRPYVSPAQVLAILMGLDAPGDRMQPPSF